MRCLVSHHRQTTPVPVLLRVSSDGSESLPDGMICVVLADIADEWTGEVVHIAHINTMKVRNCGFMSRTKMKGKDYLFPNKVKL